MLRAGGAFGQVRADAAGVIVYLGFWVDVGDGGVTGLVT